MEGSSFRVLAIGDVVARPGRLALTTLLPSLREELSIDFCIVNGENSAGGSGLDKKCYREITEAGADVITLGDHTWRRPEVRTILAEDSYACICPGNYPRNFSVTEDIDQKTMLGGERGWGIYPCQGLSIGVVNLLGRTFLNTALDCPFAYAEMIFSRYLSTCDLIIVDFHGEATSEKIAFGRRFGDRISFLFGTHTHVPTADECILPEGAAYITDLGMTGSHAGVIGMDADTAIARFLNGRPSSYKAASGDERVRGAVVEFERSSGKPISIARVERCLPS
ncbi:YmdB family metallophosphoesterase [bacterium]|nr:YmdB family metallophosphoesterase [bacterium]